MHFKAPSVNAQLTCISHFDLNFNRSCTYNLTVALIARSWRLCKSAETSFGKVQVHAAIHKHFVRECVGNKYLPDARKRDKEYISVVCKKSHQSFISISAIMKTSRSILNKSEPTGFDQFLQFKCLQHRDSIYLHYYSIFMHIILYDVVELNSL